MVKPEVIRRRLERFREYLRVLQGLQRYDLDAFLQSPERYGSAERFLQLAIEATLDIGSHVVADEHLGSMERSRDIAHRLREHGYIDSATEQRWIEMIGFRNILVHDYLEIDRRIVHETLQHRLGDLEALARRFAQFL